MLLVKKPKEGDIIWLKTEGSLLIQVLLLGFCLHQILILLGLGFPHASYDFFPANLCKIFL